MATILLNTYREPTQLLIDGDMLYLREGTTQGDLLAMPMYVLVTVLLIIQFDKGVNQVWYADDVSGVGKIANLQTWWGGICLRGPA